MNYEEKGNSLEPEDTFLTSTGSQLETKKLPEAALKIQTLPPQ
jgi:hypothetical protein